MEAPATATLAEILWEVKGIYHVNKVIIVIVTPDGARWAMPIKVDLSGTVLTRAARGLWCAVALAMTEAGASPLHTTQLLR